MLLSHQTLFFIFPPPHDIFTARQHSLLCRALVLAIVNPSVRPSVRHTLALFQNDSSYDHGVFTVG